VTRVLVMGMVVPCALICGYHKKPMSQSKKRMIEHHSLPQAGDPVLRRNPYKKLIWAILSLLLLFTASTRANPGANFLSILNSIKFMRASEHMQAPEVALSASGANVNLGAEVTLEWNSKYATSCTAIGAWQGAKAASGSERITTTELGVQQYLLNCSGDRGSSEAVVNVNVIPTEIDAWSGTKIPSYLKQNPNDFETFEGSDGVSIAGGPEGISHEPTESPGAGKFIFIRVHQATRHGLEWGEQFGWFGSWLSSFGVNSIEGGLWQNPKTAGPYYYPTLHLAGVGDTYHECSDVQMGSGMYERIIGDRWLTMLQVSNQVLTIPGSNIGFDMEQASFDDDNGIWVGWGWSYLALEHPKNYKFWTSFVETGDYQGPINAYVPEYFNWVDPEKIASGAFGETLSNYGDTFGTFATRGSEANYGNANEYYVTGTLKLSDDLFYVPIPKFPAAKSREYLLAHPQSISQKSMDSYSSALVNDSLLTSLIPSETLVFNRIYQSTHQRIKIVEDKSGEEYRYIVSPNYRVGFEGSLGFVDWDKSDPNQDALNMSSNGYGYVRRLDTKWQVEADASEDYKNHPHQYNAEIVPAPDNVVRKPRKRHRFFSYKERDTSHPDFQNWDIGDRDRYETLLQSGATATYVWYKFIEQPAMLTAIQNHPEVYTADYLSALQEHIESLHRLTNKNSGPDPTEPVFLNYRGAPLPDNKDPHLAKVDPGQLVQPLPGFEVGYVPVVLSVMHPSEVSDNGAGLQREPHQDCVNSKWTDTYYPDL